MVWTEGTGGETGGLRREGKAREESGVQRMTGRARNGSQGQGGEMTGGEARPVRRGKGWGTEGIVRPFEGERGGEAWRGGCGRRGGRATGGEQNSQGRGETIRGRRGGRGRGGGSGGEARLGREMQGMERERVMEA